VTDAPAGWLVLIYRIPAEPTRLRAAVWRRLKAAGAIYLQNSVAALPRSAAAERLLRSLRRDIVEMGGTAQVLAAEVLTGEADIVGAFNAARDDEYAEIVDRCNDFEVEIAHEIQTGHFTFGELEENDEDLSKLTAWLAKVATRDVLGATGRQSVDEALARCTTALEGFAEHVYAADSDAR